MRKVKIYDDEGVSAAFRELLPRSLSAELDASVETATIDGKGLRETSWEADCALLVMPGGRDSPYHQKLSGRGNESIRRFVEKGGAYLGFCAGAYYGSAAIEFDKGQELEVCGRRELEFFPGVAVGPAFGSNTYRYGSDAWARPARLRLAGSGSLCTVYYNGGCFFKDAETFPSVEILAYYADLPDAPAIVECACSEGKAILSGVHPEYRVDWASREADAPPGLYDELSRHEAGSRGLFRRLLSRLGLPLSS